MCISINALKDRIFWFSVDRREIISYLRGKGKKIVDGNPKQLVERGYDCIAQRYLVWSKHSPARMSYLQKVLERLSEQSQVLELGCGAGVPCTQALAQYAHVTGVDISA